MNRTLKMPISLQWLQRQPGVISSTLLRCWKQWVSLVTWVLSFVFPKEAPSLKPSWDCCVLQAMFDLTLSVKFARNPVMKQMRKCMQF